MRVLVIGDGTGRPPELEADVVPGLLASLPGVEVETVRLHPEDAEPQPGRLTAREITDRRADVWVTGSAAVLRTLGRTARAHGVRVVHRARRVVGEATVAPDVLLTALGLADAVVVPTEDAARWLADALGAATPPTVVVPPWVDRPVAEAPDVDGATFVGTGPLAGERRPMQVLRAFSRLTTDLPDWRLRLLGGGPQRRDLAALAERDGFRRRLGFSGKDVDLAAEWRTAAVAVLAPRTDPFPTDGLAAMTAGVPVVAYDAPGGMHELVEHGVNGLLVPPGSLPGLTHAMRSVATDPALRAELAHGALRTAARHAAEHGPDRAAQRWRAVLEGTPLPDLGTPRRPTAPRPARAGLPPSPREARTAALDHLVRAASSATSDWFVLPGEAPVLVVPETARAAFLGSLTAGDAPAYLSLRVPAQSGWPERRLPLAAGAGTGTPVLEGTPVALAVEPWPEDADGPSLVGQGCTVEVQLWAVGLDGALLPPQANGLVEAVTVPARTRPRDLEGLVVPVPEALGDRGIDDHVFDVDAVVTWVDGADPAWQQTRDRRLEEMGRAAQDRTVSGRARYEDHGELRYCLRSIRTFAPWVRRIHLVTAGQVPGWLDADHPDVQVVDHREILPPDALPTFSSRAIETRLHHVPGLAEHFVYLNDDVMLGRPHGIGRFFSPAGSPAVFLGDQPIGEPGGSRPAYLAAAANNRRLLREAFGVEITRTLAHTPHAHRRSVLEEVSERFADAVGATTRSPFRSDGDVSMLSSLAQHYGLITGQAHAARTDLAFLGLGAPDLVRQVQAALRRDQDFVCLADQHDYALDPAEVDAVLARFLEDYLPLAAPWEREPPATARG